MDSLKQKFAEKALTLYKELRAIGKEHGDKVMGEVTLSQITGGARGIKMMVWETSQLDAQEGIRFRGYSIPEIKKLLPSGPQGEPLPEGLFWLMLTGEIPTEEEVNALTKDWQSRAEVPQQVYTTLDSLPADTHPMTQFTIGIMAMQSDSIFDRRYAEGMAKTDHWDAVYEDSMNLIARLPRVAAYIYRRAFKGGEHIAPDTSLDWSANFAHMLGSDDEDFRSLMRLYLTIHADHEGGNASAHTVNLVGSTLSDPYRSFAAGMNALAGPLHGLANQEVIKWIFEMIEELGTKTPTKEQIQQYVQETLDARKVIPGYGHAVLREPDPRFTAQRRFAEEYIKDSDLIETVWKIFDVVPPMLEALGKVKNPWPNVDAHSGALLVHYGFSEYSFYTVLFGVSRALGVLAAGIWTRALGMPLERPKSVTSDWIKDQLK
ncbi:citrate (Si)-synthase [Neolewinella aurantiaca]|uniref:citrate synthase (unknown stereospecificity) n=1 Tax=Neolewinella aurantiaca TaxID=2602767 RepID=A0A5C7FQU4_9BACT|nr:citrate (Si)-synthase [Neolewinella aurantiaca]TXF88809.1 citrate (Si)-synthase [Neolewinella aurantiaca]